MQSTLTTLPLPVFIRGKVRDVYDLGDRLLMVASDRISAFDFVLATPVPDKGKILTQISAWWFAQLTDIADNHLISADVDKFPAELLVYREALEGRTMLVKRTEKIMIECVVRGYLAGSGWKEVSENAERLRSKASSRTQGIRPVARAHFHAVHQGRRREARRKYFL